MTSGEIVSYYDSAVSKRYREYPYFVEREEKVLSLLEGLMGDSVLDIGAGDAYWPSRLQKSFDSYICIEQGEENCRSIEISMKEKCKRMAILHADVFSCDFSKLSADTLFAGFFCSHFSPQVIVDLFGTIKKAVSPERIILLDSYWSDYRKQKFLNNEMRMQKRLDDRQGTIIVPKRYIMHEEVLQMGKTLQMKHRFVFCDDYWCLILLTL